MAYAKNVWYDNESGSTPITADKLNHIEQGVFDNAAAWDSVSHAPTLLATLTQSTSEMIVTVSGFRGYKTLHIEANGYGNIECLDIPSSRFTADTATLWQVPRINEEYNAYVRYAGGDNIAYLTGSALNGGVKVFGLS